MKYTQLVKGIDAANQQLLGHAATIVNQSLVLRNWLIGAYIIEFEQYGQDRARYGARLLERLAADLEQRHLKGLNDPRVLRDCRSLYRLYPQIRGTLSREFADLVLLPSRVQPMLPALSGASEEVMPIRGTVSRELPSPLPVPALLQLSWSKFQELVHIEDPWKRAFFENECLKGNWSVRQLQRQIGSLLYERTGLSRNKTAVVQRAQRQEPRETIADLIRDPFVLEFTGLADRAEYHESDLEKALLDHLQSFLLELGTGFLFEARQRRITVGKDHDYIDMVFYHRGLRCHILLDLKVRPFRHSDAGQMNFYLNWWQANVTTADERPPVGILLCTDKDETKVAFATAGMDNRLFVSRYLNVLPSEDQLRRVVDADRARLEATMVQPKRPVVRLKQVKAPKIIRTIRPSSQRPTRQEGRRK